MSDDASEIAVRFGLDPETVRVSLHRLAVALAGDPNADLDELAVRFEKESRAFAARYFDPASRYTGLREGLRAVVTHEAYTLIREAAGSEEPRRVACRLSDRQPRSR